MRHTICSATFLLLCAASAHAQTMYKCQDGNRTVYSDRPCWSGTEVKRMTHTGAPTPEEIAKAQMKTRDQDHASSKPQVAPDATAKHKPAAAPVPAEKPAAVATK